MTALPRSRDGLIRVAVMQGETRVSADPQVVLTTVLGSCIAACLHDPVARVGGLNHFLLAEPGAGVTDAGSMHRYGVYAMEVLINAALAMGATRTHLKARLYGGAALRRGFRDIGAANAIFARRFLRAEGIALVGEDVGGDRSRRVEFRPTAGLARCRLAGASAIVPHPAAVPLPPAGGDVEFFR